MPNPDKDKKGKTQEPIVEQVIVPAPPPSRKTIIAMIEKNKKDGKDNA